MILHKIIKFQIYSSSRTQLRPTNLNFEILNFTGWLICYLKAKQEPTDTRSYTAYREKNLKLRKNVQFNNVKSESGVIWGQLLHSNFSLIKIHFHTQQTVKLFMNLATGTFIETPYPNEFLKISKKLKFLSRIVWKFQKESGTAQTQCFKICLARRN